MLAKPDLFSRPKPYQLGDYLPTSGVVSVHLAWNEAETEWQFWAGITGKEPILQIIVPQAEDGVALFTSTPHKIDWKEDRELKRIAGW